VSSSRGTTDAENVFRSPQSNGQRTRSYVTRSAEVGPGEKSVVGRTGPVTLDSERWQTCWANVTVPPKNYEVTKQKTLSQWVWFRLLCSSGPNGIKDVFRANFRRGFCLFTCAFKKVKSHAISKPNGIWYSLVLCP